MVLLELGFAESRFICQNCGCWFLTLRSLRGVRRQAADRLSEFNPQASPRKNSLGRRVDAVPFAPDHEGQILAPLPMNMEISSSARFKMLCEHLSYETFPQISYSFQTIAALLLSQSKDALHLFTNPLLMLQISLHGPALFSRPVLTLPFLRSAND